MLYLYFGTPCPRRGVPNLKIYYSFHCIVTTWPIRSLKATWRCTVLSLLALPRHVSVVAANFGPRRFLLSFQRAPFPFSVLNLEKIETKTTTTKWINLTNSQRAVEPRGCLLLELGSILSGSRGPGRRALGGLPREGLTGDSGCVRALGTRLPSSCGAAASGGGSALHLDVLLQIDPLYTSDRGFLALPLPFPIVFCFN